MDFDCNILPLQVNKPYQPQGLLSLHLKFKVGVVINSCYKSIYCFHSWKLKMNISCIRQDQLDLPLKICQLTQNLMISRYHCMLIKCICWNFQLLATQYLIQVNHFITQNLIPCSLQYFLPRVLKGQMTADAVRKTLWRKLWGKLHK